MREIGRCAVCNKHYELRAATHNGQRLPRIHYTANGQRCKGCDVPALPKAGKTNGQRTDKLILGFIVDYIGRQGIPPTVREIALDVKRSTSCVFACLKRLEKQGAIKVHRGMSRGIVLQEQAEREGK